MTKKEPTQPATTETVQEQVAEPRTAELSISDLHSLRAIIDLASTRGAFKASEMAAVGQAYNKLNNFLEEVTKSTDTKGV